MKLHYTPALISVVLAIIFISWPLLAATLLAGILFLFAFSYAAVVYRFNQFRKSANRDAGNDEFGNWQEPNVRNVTVYLRNRSSNLFR